MPRSSNCNHRCPCYFTSSRPLEQHHADRNHHLLPLSLPPTPPPSTSSSSSVLPSPPRLSTPLLQPCPLLRNAILPPLRHKQRHSNLRVPTEPRYYPLPPLKNTNSCRPCHPAVQLLEPRLLTSTRYCMRSERSIFLQVQQPSLCYNKKPGTCHENNHDDDGVSGAIVNALHLAFVNAASLQASVRSVGEKNTENKVFHALPAPLPGTTTTKTARQTESPLAGVVLPPPNASRTLPPLSTAIPPFSSEDLRSILSNLALADVSFPGNALFLSTPQFPGSTRDLAVGGCRYLNMDSISAHELVSGNARRTNGLATAKKPVIGMPPTRSASRSLPAQRKDWPVGEGIAASQAVARSAKLEIFASISPATSSLSPPQTYLDILLPVYRISDHQNSWDLLVRVDVTVAIQALVRATCERGGGRWLHREVLGEGNGVAAVWRMDLEGNKDNKSTDLLVEGDDGDMGAEEEDIDDCSVYSRSTNDSSQGIASDFFAFETAAVILLARSALAALEHFVIFVPGPAEGWTLGFISTNMMVGEELQSLPSREISLLLDEGGDREVIEIHRRHPGEVNGVKRLELVKVGDGRIEGRTWWLGFLVEA